MEKGCKQLQWVPAYIDQIAEDEKNAAFESHIRQCEDCRLEYDDLNGVVSICSNIEEEELPEGFSEKLHARLLKDEKGRQEKPFYAARSFKLAASVAASLIVLFFAYSFSMQLQHGPATALQNTHPKDGGTALPKSEAENLQKAAGTVENNAAIAFQDTDQPSHLAFDNNKSAAPQIMSSTVPTTNSLSKNSIRLNITSSHPEDAEKKLGELITSYANRSDAAPALTFGAETESNEQGYKAASDRMTANESGKYSNVIRADITNTSYSQFLSELNKIFGSSLTGGAKPESADISADIEELRKQLAQAEKDILDAKSNGSGATAQSIEERTVKRDQLRARLDQMLSETESIAVSITIAEP